MKYSAEIYEKVINEVYSKKLKHEKELEKRKVIFYTRFPKAKEIELKLASLSLKVARAVLKGGNVRDELVALKEKHKFLKKELGDIINNSAFPSNYLEMEYTCDKCNDEGYIDGKMCECIKNLMKQEVYKSVNNTSRLSSCTFENFSTEYYPAYSINEGEPNARTRIIKVLDFCKRYAKEFSINPRGLLFVGQPGVGKTHLALSIANEVIRKGYLVVYSSAHNIVSQIERGKFNGEMLEIEAQFTRCHLLILDDLGGEFKSNFSNTVIYNILDARAVSGLPVIITTNLTLSELKEVYPSRILSRITGSNTQLKIFGNDIRQKLIKTEEKKNY